MAFLSNFEESYTPTQRRYIGGGVTTIGGLIAVGGFGMMFTSADPNNPSSLMPVFGLLIVGAVILIFGIIVMGRARRDYRSNTAEQVLEQGPSKDAVGPVVAGCVSAVGRSEMQFDGPLIIKEPPPGSEHLFEALIDLSLVYPELVVSEALGRGMQRGRHLIFALEVLEYVASREPEAIRQSAEYLLDVRADPTELVQDKERKWEISADLIRDYANDVLVTAGDAVPREASRALMEGDEHADAGDYDAARSAYIRARDLYLEAEDYFSYIGNPEDFADSLSEVNAKINEVTETEREEDFEAALEREDQTGARDILLDALEDDQDHEPFGTILVRAADANPLLVEHIASDLAEQLGTRTETIGPEIAAILSRIADARPAVLADDVIPPVIGLLQDHRWEIRRDAGHVIGAIGGRSELESLRELKNDDEYQVRVAALQAIRDIAEREDVALTADDQRELQQINIEYAGSGDVVAGDQVDQSTAIEDSVVNRSDIGDTGSQAQPGFCPSCGTDLSGHGNPSFCPECGQDL